MGALSLPVFLSQDQDQDGGAPEPVRLCPGSSGVV